MIVRARFRVTALAAAVVVVMLVAVPAHAAGKTVHITKSDSAGNAVQGATFTLYVDAAPVGGGPPKGAEDTVVQGTCTTGANGQCDITDVPPGNYWVSETGPPAGYVAAPDSTLEVKKGKKKVFEVVVVDDKKPANTSVNDPTGDVAVDDGTHIFQFGPSVAVSPNGEQVGIAFNDSAGFFAGGGGSGVGWAFSTDRGRTFEDLGQIPTGGDDRFVLVQPSVVFNPASGAFIVAAQGAFVTGQEVTLPVVVSRYEPASAGWSPLVNTFPELPPDSSAHDPWLAVDSSPASPYAGTVYLGFTVSAGGQAQGFLTRSRNGGRTWSDPVAVTALGTNDFLNPTVGLDGRVYVAWTDFGGAGASTNDVYVARSTDGGRTFSQPFPVVTDVPKAGEPTSCGGSTGYAYFGELGSGSPPRIAVDPADPNRIFVAYSGSSGADVGDVFVSESRHRGESWLPAVRLADSAGTQLYPDLVVTPDGRIAVTYYQAASSSQVDFVVALFDGFAAPLTSSLHAVVPVTDEPFPLWDTNPAYDSFYGDCFGLQGNRGAAPGSGFYVAWTDGGDPGPAGNGGIDPNIEFARIDPALATTTTLSISSGGSIVGAAGAVEPDPVLTARVTLTLFFDDGPGGFERVDRVRPVLGPGGTFGVSINPTGGTCKLVVKFGGSEGRLASSASETFDC